MKTYFALLLATTFAVTTCYPVNDKQEDIPDADTNNNGIRDDVEAYIDQQPYSARQLSAIRQLAKNVQLSVTFNSKGREAARAISEQGSLAVNYIYSQFLVQKIPGLATAISNAIENLTANTRARKQSYDKFNKLLSGMSFKLSHGDTCE